MFTTNLKRSRAALAVTAGLLVAAAGPASASPSEPLITPPQPKSGLMADSLKIDGLKAPSSSDRCDTTQPIDNNEAQVEGLKADTSEVLIETVTLRRTPVDDMDLSIRADAVNPRTDLSLTAQDGDSTASALVDYAPGVCYAK